MEVAFVVDNYSRCVIRTGFRSIDRAEEEGGGAIFNRELLVWFDDSFTPFNSSISDFIHKKLHAIKRWSPFSSQKLRIESFGTIIRTFRFESVIIRWCRKKIVTVTFSFFLWPSHRDSKWINWRSNRSGRDGGAASNDVYMAQITWSTIRGRDNRDDPFSFPARDYSTLVDFSTKGSAVGNWWSPLVFAAHYIPVISHATDGGAVSIVLPYFMRDEHRLWLNISKICWLD